MAVETKQTHRISLGHCLAATGALGLLAAGLLWAEPNSPDLAGARLEGANLNGVRLSGAALDAIRLSGATLQNADFSRADLRLAALSHADLGFTRFRGACLQGADLRSVTASGADFRGADLREARLEGACLETVALADANLFGATYNECTTWPDGFDPQRHGAVCISPEEADNPREWNGPQPKHLQPGQHLSRRPSAPLAGPRFTEETAAELSPEQLRNLGRVRAAARMGPPFLPRRDFTRPAGV